MMFLLISLIANGLTQSYFLINFPRIKFLGLEGPLVSRTHVKDFFVFFVSMPILSHILLPRLDKKGEKMNWVAIMTFNH